MLILAVDTSGKFGSVALAQCERDACTPLEVVALEGGTFSAQLVPQIAGLLAKHGFGKTDLEGFAVASGPGSFTGLRVGLAAVKALAEVLQKPIAAVSLLEAVATMGKNQSRTLAVLDAGRTQVYVAEYAEGRLDESGERLLTREQLWTEAARAIVLTPDQAVATAARTAHIEVRTIERPQSDLIALLGYRKIQSGHIISAEDLEANYIRRSDAEIFSKADS